MKTLGQRMRIVKSAQSINTLDEIIERVVDMNGAPNEEPETNPKNEHGVVDNYLEGTISWSCDGQRSRFFFMLGER